ncbi:PRP3-domain-containing protein [Thozetella sp. PMI_491]|nr:PRP3-domain-containing protein [Thozetella sp. PMI_491]
MDRRPQSSGFGPRHDPSSRVQKPESAADKVAALKARVAAAIGGSKAAKGGLNVGIHPMLQDLGDAKPSGNTSADSIVNVRSAPGANKSSFKKKPSGADGRGNPYLENSAVGPTGKARASRPLVFNQKGVYIQQANALRRQAALEVMKKRIADQTRRAGIDEDLDAEKAFAVEPPPDVEWWDEGICGKNYDTLDDVATLKIDTPDSIITELVQHPVLIEPPQDALAPAPKPMYLTPKEQKKLRRQRRMAEMKEHQAKQRLGLEPAPAPKVKKSNLMRVLGEEAVKDPTAVEARVNREIEERYHKHLDANEERKLTKEQRHDKLAANQEKDAAKGIHLLVFKIGNLANGQHRYKISINAEQLALTGVCIVHPKFSLLVVEGGEYSINKYKKLILNRIDWTENVPSRPRDGNQGTVRQWLDASDENGNLRDLSHNYAQLLFEGETKARAFRKWSSKVCETDSEAREALARAKVDNFWIMAKNAP